MVNDQTAVEHQGSVIQRLERHQFHAAPVVHEQTAAGEVSLGAAVLAASKLDAVDAVVVFDVPAGQRVAFEDADAALGGTETVEHTAVHL